jgi:E3 ubiquitin-protein ligase TRIP12
MSQLGSSRPLLEVSFDGEVGTGFGPTLEFYSTLSREMQKHSNRLWQGTPTVHTEEGEAIEYTTAENGLYPIISRQTTGSRAWDSRTKRFEFFGRLLAQAMLDARIVSLLHSYEHFYCFFSLISHLPFPSSNGF